MGGTEKSSRFNTKNEMVDAISFFWYIIQRKFSNLWDKKITRRKKNLYFQYKNLTFRLSKTPMKMDAKKVDIFLAQNAEKLPEIHIPKIKQDLLTQPEEKTDTIAYMQFKDPKLILNLSIFLGLLGVDRFFLGDRMRGILKMVTYGGCGIWWLLDLFTAMERARKCNYKKLYKVL